VKPALDALHSDGKDLMGSVSSHIDAAKPEGVFDRNDVAGTLKDAMGVVKDPSKVPASVSKLMNAENAEAPSPTIDGQKLNISDPQQAKVYQKLKASGAFDLKDLPQAANDKMSFEELKQVHSDIGRQIANAEGAPEAGLKTAYGKLGEMLRKEADSNGMLDQWQDGINKVRTFNNIAYRGPLKDTYLGENHGQIMKGLVNDDTGPTAIKQLEALAPYGVDVDKLKQTVQAYKYGDKMDTFANPSRRTLIAAALNPKIAALMQFGPAAMRSDRVTTSLFGKGLDAVPDVKPNKLYPSKVAAAQELKGNPTPFGGGE
jgi:hypothetical protein